MDTATSLHMQKPSPPGFDINRRFVRFRALSKDGFVEFDFSIGDPGLSVELVMPFRDYQSFCVAHRVTWLTRTEGEALDADQSKWRYGQPGLSE
ncbi:phenol 2-monooxygenase [Paraburkholderia jirisanensis]